MVGFKALSLSDCRAERERAQSISHFISTASFSFATNVLLWTEPWRAPAGTLHFTGLGLILGFGFRLLKPEFCTIPFFFVVGTCVKGGNAGLISGASCRYACVTSAVKAIRHDPETLCDGLESDDL